MRHDVITDAFVSFKAINGSFEIINIKAIDTLGYAACMNDECLDPMDTHYGVMISYPTFVQLLKDLEIEGIEVKEWKLRVGNKVDGRKM